MKNYVKVLTIAVVASTVPSVTYAGFDWGENGESCSGTGNFKQQILSNAITTVGEIPSGKKGVYIKLTSDKDVDVQLYDKSTGEKIAHWPDGIMRGAGKQNISYNGVSVEWSGYNGDGTGKGHEYIKISGTTNRALIMKAYGFQAGFANIDYSWSGTQGCTEGGTSKSGSGKFQQQILDKAIITVGDIPIGIDDLFIELKSSKDVDIQLYDKDNGTKIVVWPDGILKGGNKQTTSYEGMSIEWSGYNGDGTGLGNEYIKITGSTSRKLTMKAYGYQAGYATVNYQWGNQNNEGGGTTSRCDSSSSTQLTLENTRYNEKLEAGGNYYRIDISQSGYLAVYSEGDVDTYGELLASDCSVVYGHGDHNNGPGNNFRVRRFVDPGIYYAYVKNEGATSDKFISMSAVLLSPNPNDDHPNVCLSDRLKELGSATAGTLQGRYDQDVFKIDLKRPGSFQLSIDNSKLGFEVVGMLNDGWCGAPYYNLGQNFNANFPLPKTMFVNVRAKSSIGTSTSQVENYILSLNYNSAPTGNPVDEGSQIDSDNCVALNSKGVSFLEWPFKDPNSWNLTNGCSPGQVTKGCKHSGRDSYAIDLNKGSYNDDLGEVITSATVGQVVFSGLIAGYGYGNTVIVKADDSLAIRYAHLNERSVVKGDKVSVGTKIGTVGKSGKQSYSHLHMALYDLNKSSVSPNGYIAIKSGFNSTDIAKKFKLKGKKDGQCALINWPSSSAFNY